MLVQFTVENFLSFKGKTVFSLRATKDDSHPIHLVSNVLGNNGKVLRAAGIYGANASGKSNLIKAMKFARDLIIEGTKGDEDIPVTPFKLGTTLNEPSRFQFNFFYKGILYSYGFKVNSTQILEEFLYATVNGKEVKYFERVTSEELKTEVDFGTILTKGNTEKRNFLKYKEADTRPNQLFLTTVFEGNIRDRVEEFVPVVAWFQSVLTIIEAEKKEITLEKITHTREALKEYLGKILRASDTGITEVSTTEILLDWERDLPWGSSGTA